MKNDKETELRLKINHNYFTRTVVVEVCMQIILILIAGFIYGMCMTSDTNTAFVFGIITLVAYVVFTLARIHKIVTLHGKITEYEDSVVEDTIHSALK